MPADFPINYTAEQIPLPENFLPVHPWNNGEMVNRDENLLAWPRSPDAIRTMLAEYYRYISYLDMQIGRVLDVLDASPEGKNTLIVFASDSGVARGSHGLVGKQNRYEHSVRVPLIIAGPGIPAGRTTDALCYLFDVLPTLGKLSAVPAPPTSEGIDLAATLADPTQPARPELIFAYRNLQRAIVQERWKLIRYPLVDQTQLFDLQADPLERSNLAQTPQQAARVASLSAALEKEMASAGDTSPLKVANPLPAAWSPPAPMPTAPPLRPTTEPRIKGKIPASFCQRILPRIRAKHSIQAVAQPLAEPGVRNRAGRP